MIQQSHLQKQYLFLTWIFLRENPKEIQSPKACCLKYNGIVISGLDRLAAAAAKSLQSRLTLCDPVDSSPPGSPLPGILQAEHWSGLPFPSPIDRLG